MITGSKKQQILPEHGTAEADVDHADSTSQFTPVFTPEQHVGTALRHTFRAFADAVSENLVPLGLNLNMWFVLRALWEEDGRTQVALAHKLGVTPAAMVGILNNMQNIGLVVRKRSKDDRRAFFVFLTPQGRKVRTQATRQALQVDARALRGMGLDETRLLLSLLKKMRENLGTI